MSYNKNQKQNKAKDTFLKKLKTKFILFNNNFLQQLCAELNLLHARPLFPQLH